MKRLTMIGLLVALSLQWGCSNSSSSPITPGGSSTPTYTYPFLFSWTATGASLYGIVAQDNDVFVADANSKAWKYDLNGNLYFNFPATGATGIAMDKNNDVYVTDNSTGVTRIFDVNGNALSTIGAGGSGGAGQFTNPWAVAVNDNLDVYVADAGNNRIQKYSHSGAVWTSTQSGVSNGSGNGQFYYPFGLALDASGNLYVADTYNNRIQKLDSNLNYLSQFGSAGTGNGTFSTPTGIAVDSDGNLLVCDTGNHIVQKLSPIGTYLGQVGGAGTGPGKFTTPRFVAVDSGKNVYVTDNNNRVVSKFAPY